MSVKTKEIQKLLDYQLSDFLEFKLGKSEKRLISKIKRRILKTSCFTGRNLYEFPAIGTASTCFVLPNGFSKKLKQLCLVDSDGSLKRIWLR